MYSLERLDKITKQAPETKHEASFQHCYGSVIQKAIEKFRMPLDPLDSQKNWEPLKQVGVHLEWHHIYWQLCMFQLASSSLSLIIVYVLD